MAAFDPKNLKPASKSAEFGAQQSGAHSAKAVLLAGIDNQLALYKGPAGAEGRRWWTTGKQEIAFSLRYQNKALKLLGDERIVTCPIDHFEAALLHFRKEIEIDKYADQLVEMEKLGEQRLAKMRATRAGKQGEATPA